MQRVIPLPPLDRQYFPGNAEINVEVTNLFGLVRILDGMAPGFEAEAEKRARFSVNGAIQADWSALLPQDCEILLVPRIFGGS